MVLYPHLAWYLDGNSEPYLYRRDDNRRKFQVRYDTFMEAAQAAGMDSDDIENYLRSR